MKLTIVIPYYKTYEYTEKLLKRIEPQITEEVEVIVIDDGCCEKRLEEYPIRVIHLEKNSGGASVPRNVGIDNARGEYIAFIDADDMVSEKYIERILEKIKEEWEYFYIGWSSKWGEYIYDEPEKWNTCVWNCVYKKEMIGKERFDPKIRIGEDKDFNQRVRKGRHSSIKEVLYYYDTEVENSLTWGQK